MTEKVVIIGSGPAGHTAAIYAARANLNPLMFEGIQAGGQLTTTTVIENFPGFQEGINGMELMTKMKEQSLHAGVRILSEEIHSVQLSSRPFKVKSQTQELESETLIIATGATAKKLNIPGEEQFWQRGISACAVCDGALPAFRNKVLVVIGGGDSAAEEALHLSRFGSKIYLIHRRDQLRASQIMQKRLLKNPKIEIIWNTVVTEAKGQKILESVNLKNVQNGEIKNLACSGLFYAIGHTPNTNFLKNQILLDKEGFIITQSNSTKTSIKGVFACGDVQDRYWKQAITAAGTGCMAALETERFLTGVD
ncbi:MAG: thioredoxin-disulfide reductase [Candidatus Aureabacteria bacterium]|nr:thioredoxin-disulfide reductase [Candidatus Auribacterota bacterium]